MIREIKERKKELQQLCLESGVIRLGLFGSAITTAGHTDESDLDFVVELEAADCGKYADAYFRLLESLGRMFGRPVDLVVGSAIRNPYFLEEVEKTKVLIYDAGNQEISL